MICSMTGFGDASVQEDDTHYHVELRSLNNKYFKALTRLPEEIAGLEAELESRLRRQVHRGSFTLSVKLKLGDDHAASRVNDAALMTYLDHLATIHDKISDQAVHIDLTQMLAMPGVLQSSRDDQALMARARPVLLRLVDQAADRLSAMRTTEGRGLAKDLLAQRDVIRDRLEQVQSRAPTVIHEYHQKLRSRIDHLMARAELKVGEADLIREVAVFADRADISEELSRLSGHLDQFEKVLASEDDEPAGRTLEFLTQEMLREANTIGSKSNDTAISHAVVEMKSAIDRIKEQVQNVE